ncbi:helix-turn-helix domain-containing protein [Methanobrevibacter sp. DSM 116169]|uniref:helix-turn-helix domain-containing protein n=1 Tax=Methanobrevibacter sp. DSM 116169 TaxID=3242727 RepID=UPI0038FCC957
MNEFNKNIGNRIRELRELSDKTTKEFADELDIEENVYEKYESGELDIPASFLNEIAHILKVDLSLLLTGEETRMHIFDVTRKGKGISVDRRKQYKYENLCNKFIHKKAEMFVITVDPREDEPTLNAHAGQEFNYILEGTMKIYIHNNEIILNEGDSIFFDSRHKHGMKAMNNEKVKFLAAIM